MTLTKPQAAALEAHLAIDRYGEFLLTGAIRPGLASDAVQPRAGWRRAKYHSATTGDIPALMAAISAEKLFDCFLDLVDAIGADELCAAVDSDHDIDEGGPVHRAADTFIRREIDLPVLKSCLCEFEHEILDDGFIAVAAWGAGRREVQLDFHKLLVCYGAELEAFEAVLGRYGLKRDDYLPEIVDGQHVHQVEVLGAEREE